MKYLLDLKSFVFPPCPSNVDSGTFTFQCGVALWLVDFASKNFIADCWRQRGKFLSGLASFSNFVPLKIPVPTKKAVQVWAPNTRSSKWTKEVRGRHCSGRAAFYIVVKGRKCGVFYKWEDCLASVANFDQAVFFGANSLEEA